MPIAANQVNAVAVSVRPQAQLDPVTLMPIPTIAVAVGTGNAGQVGTVLMDDGTAVNYSQPSNDGVSVAFTAKGEVVWTYSNAPNVTVLPLQTANVSVTNAASTARDYGINSNRLPYVPNTNFKRTAAAGRTLAAMGAGSNILTLFRENPGTQTAGLQALITGTYNTGYMTGDIRRCLLADTYAGTVGGPDVVTNGSNTGAPDSFTATTGWAVGGGCTLGINAGRLEITNTATNGWITFPITTTPNETYTLNIKNSSSGTQMDAYVDGTQSGSNPHGTMQRFNAGTVGTLTFTATKSSSWVVIYAIGAAGAVGLVGQVSLKESIPDRSVKAKPGTVNGTLSMTAVAAGAQMVAASGFSALNYIQEAYSADLDPGTGAVTMALWGTIPTNVAAAGWGVDRSGAAGSYYRLGHSATGQIVAELFDGTTLRTLTTTQTYSTGQFLKARASYVPAGASSTLTITVNGVQVAQSTFAALGTLTNAAAVLTVGNRRALDGAWAGSLCLVKVGMTVPFAQQAAWMYAQELAMFQPGAQVTLADTGAVLGIDYDEVADKLLVVTAANECNFQGLRRVSATPSPAGSYSRVFGGAGGIELTARTGTNPGVDITIPPQNLRAELLRRSEAAKYEAGRANGRVFDFDATTGQLDFPLPIGWEVSEVLSAGASKREGSTKDWTRVDNGFFETTRFSVAPGNGAWVQLIARRAA